MSGSRLDLSSVTDAIHLVGSAVSDTKNALGETDALQKVEAYGNLVPGILTIASQAGLLPQSVSTVPQSAQQAIADQVAKKVPTIPAGQAPAAVTGMLSLFAELAKVILSHSTELAHIFKK